MKLLCFSFSNQGGLLGEKLLDEFEASLEIKHINSKTSDEKIRDIVAREFDNYDGLIFISATGIAIRYIAHLIKDKKTDPAIIVIDDLGRYVISLLSGHLGGANQLAIKIASKIGASPIITTATDGRNIEAIDMYAKRKDYTMLDMESVKDVTSLMVDGKLVGLYSDYYEDIDYKNIVKVDNLEDLPDGISGLIIVSNKKIYENFSIPSTILVPKNINIGLGCKRGVETKRILEAIYSNLDRESLYIESLRAMGTVDVKKDELGILEASKVLELPLRIFTIDELKKVESIFEGSDFVKNTIGVSCVSEPSAFLLGDRMIVLKSKHNGITISISEGGNDE